MRKKFTMLFAALLACVGAAWADSAVITDVAQLTDDMNCTVSTASRGGWAVNEAGDNFGSTNDHGFGTTVNPENKQHLFQFRNIDGNFYLYSVYAEKFVNMDRTLSVEAAQAIEFLPQGDNTFVVRFDNAHNINLGGSYQMAIDGWGPGGTNTWGSADAGNKVTITAVSVGPKTKLSLLVDEVLGSAAFGKLPLQVNDAKGAYYLSSCGSADGNVEGNMIDGEDNTFYGSPWQSSVGQEHYWQVDLGEGVALSEFVFNYTTRADGRNTPSRMTVLGSADGSTFDATLATIEEGLPEDGGARYESTTIINSDNYRYLRFQAYDEGGYSVKEGETTLAIAEFELFNTDQNTWSAEDKALKAAVEAAQALLENSDATDEQYEDAYVAIKKASVVMPEFPFIVTTDDESPVLYAIKSGRDNEGKEWWYTYVKEDGKIALSQYTGANEQWWFFKAVVTEDYQYAVQLYPYADAAKAMSYRDTGNGADKVVAQTLETEGWTNLWWSVSTNGTAPYGLQTYNKQSYLSNFNGVNSKMGMYASAPANDGGTAMYFSTPAEALQALINAAEVMLANEGTAPGYCTAESLAGLKAAVDAAKENMANKNYSVTDLNAAIAAVEVVPVTAGYYFIKNTGDANNNANWYLTHKINNNAECLWAQQPSGALTADYVWKLETCEDGYKMQCVNLGKYFQLKTATNGGDNNTYITEDYEQGNKMLFTSASFGTGKFSIKNGNGENIRTEGSGQVNSWNGEKGESWSLVPVTELEITINEFASICLPFDVKPGEGVKAYAIESTNSTHAILAEKADIPAGEGAILEGQGTVKLNLTTATSDWESNMLEGTFVDTYVQGAAYVLAKKNDVIGLYKASLNKNEAGEAGETHFKNNANKAYLVVEGTNAPMFSFDRGEGTTGIDNSQLTIDNSAVIYDLAGRRVEKMEKGIYIVNGRKVIR